MCSWYDLICHAKSAYHTVKRGVTKVASAIGNGVVKVAKTVGNGVVKAVNTVAAPVVSAVEYVGKKTGLDKVVKGATHLVREGVEAVGSAIKHSGKFGHALADAWDSTSAFNPIATGVSAIQATDDVVQGKMSVGQAAVGIGLKKWKKTKKLVKTAQKLGNAKTAHKNIKKYSK